MSSRTLNILLNEDQEFNENNDKTINLIEENLFKLQCIIKANDIRLSARHEYHGKELLAFTIGTKDLGLYYVFDSSQPPIIKNVPWFQGSTKAITALCFDPSGYWLLIVSVDGSIHLIPAAGLVDAKRKKNQQKWKDTDDIISFSSLNSQSFCSRPSSLIWWQCMSVSSQIGIVGTEQGEILFIDLDTGQQVGLTRIDEHISNLQICQDSELDTINLIITSLSKKQWYLILEQPAKGYVYTLNNGITGSELYLQGSSSAPTDDNEKTFVSTIKRWQTKSRLKGLKQLSFDNFSILKKKSTKNKTGSFDGPSLCPGSINSNYSQCNGSDTLMNPSPTNSAAFLILHYADHGRRLYTRYFPPKSILTIHENSTSLLPLCVHKLPDSSKDILLTHHLFYVIDFQRQTLYIISRSLSQDKLKGNSQFNQDSIVARFLFGKRNEIINGLFIANTSKDLKDNSFYNNEETYIIPKFIKDLKIKLVPVNPCIIVTNCGIYRVTLKSSLLSIFMDLIISRAELEKAKRLAKIFGLHVRQLLEYAGDILLANDKFYQATTMFKEARCRPSKIFAKLASVGCTSELLNCLVHYLEHPAPHKLSIAERMSLSNLSIIAFTELSVRATTQKEQQIHKDFLNFLSSNMFYDELVAVSIVGQAHLWNVLHHLIITRGLFAQVLDILMKTLPLFFNFKNSYLHSNHDLLMTVSEPNLIRGMVANSCIAKSHMSFVLANLPSLQEFVLQRLITLYNPTNPVLRPLMVQCRLRRRSNSRNSLTSSVELTEVQEEMANLAEKIVEMFLTILLIMIQKTTPTLSYNAELMKMISLLELKKSDNEVTSNIQYKRRFISAGFSHVALLRNKVIYTWGSTVTDTGPVTGSVYETPKEINIFRRMGIEVISVSSGHCHTLALTNNGVYAWGGSKFGQVGLEKLTQCPSPQLISSLANEIIIDCIAGQYHSVALTSDGRVFTWGWGVHGQLGHGNTENMHVPTLVVSLIGIAIKHISAGHAHTMILSSDGIVYVFGCNNVGQLGTATIKKCLVPTKVTLLPEKISFIATKYFHNLAVTSTNRLYVWGISPRELQLKKLKVPDSEVVDENEKQKFSSSSSSSSSSISVNVNEQSPPLLECDFENVSTPTTEQDESFKNRIIRVNNQSSGESIYNGGVYKNKDKKSCINRFSTFNQEELQNSEKAVNENYEKQSNNAKLSRIYWRPSLVDTSLVKGQIIQISTGWNHSALLTKDGTVYIWGKNTCGQLGNNNRSEIVCPTQLIYNPVLSFSQVSSKGTSLKSVGEKNGLNIINNTSNYGLDNEKERFNIDESNYNNKEVKKYPNMCDDGEHVYNDDDQDADNIVNNDDDEAVDDESRDNCNYHNDLNEKDIDDFENHVNLNTSILKATEVSCGSNYTVAIQQGGAILAWGRIGVTHSKSSAFFQLRKQSDKKNCDNVEENSNTLKYLLNTFGLHKNEVVGCISNPSQVPNIPVPTISYQSYDTVPLVGFMPMFNLLEKIPGTRTLHYALEQFSGFYDVHKILKKCIALGNHQACAKLSLLEHNYSESLIYQLKSLMDMESIREVNEKDTNFERKEERIEDFKISENVDKQKTILKLSNDTIDRKQQMNKSSTLDNLNDSSSLLFNEQVEEDLVNSFEESVSKIKMKLPSSKSMDTFSLTEHELHTFDCQGGLEGMYGQIDDDDNNISEQLTMTNSITFDDELESDDSSERLKSEGAFIADDYTKDNCINLQGQSNENTSSIIKAMSIVEFYINEIKNFNPSIMSDLLLNTVNIWVNLCLPLHYLEKVFLKHLHKIFYPLGLLLFCQNSPSEDVNKDDIEDIQVQVKKAIDSLSTKLALSVCSVLLQHIRQGKSTPEYVELLSQFVAKYYGPPLTGYPGSSGNQSTEKMLEGMKITLSSKQSDPRPFIHIKDPDQVSRFLEMENDSIVFTCGHYFPIPSTEIVTRMETELLMCQPLPLPCTAQVLGRAFQQTEQLETLCPLCIPRALQTVVNNLTNR